MSSNKVRILYLEADNADAETVAALVGILHEAQGGHGLAPVAMSASLPSARALRSAEPASSVADIADEPREQVAPPPVRRAPRRSQSAALRGRGQNVGGTLLALLRKTPRPDFTKFADHIYGDASRSQRVKHALYHLVRQGKVRDNKDGSYTVL